METSSGLERSCCNSDRDWTEHAHAPLLVSATAAIGAMVAFAILSILLLLGLLSLPSSQARLLVPWSLLVFAIAGVAMIVANKRSGQD